MKVYEQDNTVIIEDIKDFDPKHIFECGQCFRWIKEDDESYRLSKEAKRYMKEKYFLNDNEEEETNDNKTGLVRSKTLRLLDNEMEE